MTLSQKGGWRLKKGKNLLDINTGKDAQHSNQNYKNCNEPGLREDIHNARQNS